MARMTLSPTDFTPATPLDLSTVVASIGANTGVEWVNTGHELLVVTLGSTASTATINIGTTVAGQSVTPITHAVPVSTTSVFPPFSSLFDQPDGSYDVFVDFSSQTGLLVGLLKVTPAS